MRLKTGELLALASSGKPPHALARYRRRWSIETLFANLKTQGFDMEATHLTDPKKLKTLLVLMAVAAALAAKTGAGAVRARPIPVKKHGRRAISHFAFGLTVLRKILARKISGQVIAFLHALVFRTQNLRQTPRHSAACPLTGLRRSRSARNCPV